jgi:hypothetical protein
MASDPARMERPRTADAVRVTGSRGWALHQPPHGMATHCTVWHETAQTLQRIPAARSIGTYRSGRAG